MLIYNCFWSSIFYWLYSALPLALFELMPRFHYNDHLLQIELIQFYDIYSKFLNKYNIFQVRCIRQWQNALFLEWKAMVICWLSYLVTDYDRSSFMQCFIGANALEMPLRFTFSESNWVLRLSQLLWWMKWSCHF